MLDERLFIYTKDSQQILGFRQLLFTVFDLSRQWAPPLEEEVKVTSALFTAILACL